MKAGLAAILVAFVMLGALSATPARADATITASTVANNFPRDIVFHIEANAPVEITDVTLNYHIAGRSISALGKPDFLKSATSVDTDVTVTTGGNSYIPVGSEFIYHWELALADGTTTTSADESFLYLPPGDEWQSVENDIVRVYYQGDRQATAQQYLDAGLETYQAIAVDIFNTELTVLPVKVVLFAEEADLEAARPGGSGTFDAAVVNCGLKVTTDIVFVINMSCGTPDRTDTFRHEFTHIINEAAGEGPLGVLPAWLDEGMAVHGQSDPGDNYIGAFESGVRANRLIPFNEMATAASDASLVNLFYGESYAMVDYLINKDGPSTFAEYFATIKAGSRFDTALEQVYGFNIAGFEEEFYAANGLSAPGVPTAVPTAGSSQSNPTPAPTRPPLETSNSSKGDNSKVGPVAIGIVGAAVLFALIAVFLYLMSVMMENNRKSSAGQAPPPSEDDQWRPPPPPSP